MPFASLSSKDMIKATKVILSILVVIAVFLAGFWCGTSRGSVKMSTGSIKVGVLGDLSGDYVSFLRGIARGAEMAAEDMSRTAGRKIKLVVEDQRSCDSQATITAVNKMIFVDRVDFIVGGSCSNTTLAAASLANREKTVMISPSSSAPSVSGAGDYIFRTCPSDALKGKWAAKVAFELGKRRMAFIVGRGNEANLEAADKAKQEFLSLGGVIAAEEKVDDKSSDVRTQLTKVKESHPDVLLISITSPSQIGLLLKQAKEIGFDQQIVHPMEAPENQEVIDIAGPAAEGLIYLMQGNPPATPQYESLKLKYQIKYNEQSMPQYLTESYDALTLGVKAVLASNGTKEDIKNKLYEVSKSYQGVSGSVAFDENGDVQKPVLIKQIKNGKFVPYEE